MTGTSLAVDIGGTFTDAVLHDGNGRTFVGKTLTTHDDLLIGFFGAVDEALERAAMVPNAVDDVIVHATTVVTNAVIERKGPRTAMIVTQGFGDVLTIRDEHRYDMFDPQIEFHAPLIPRDLTFGVAERVYADGTVATPVDAAEVAALAGRLLEGGVVSVAVCLLNAYRNPANERRIRDLLAAAAPGLYVSISSEVAPQIREYLRASTTAINAYAQPITQPYLRRLAGELTNRGMRGEPLIMLSNGGVIGGDVAGRFPVRMIESGPAAGALVAGHFAARLGRDKLMSFDMGGTTAKACVIQDQTPLVTGMFEVDRRYRFKAGSGMPIIVPCIDMIEIGAGGGSIAGIDRFGLLKVGPESAGSEPGPVCYGRGGAAPTVTDADLVLGLLDAHNFLGGDMVLDNDGAEHAISALAGRLGRPLEETALGIYRVVGESMAAAARAHATDRGLDYRGMPMLAFGGAGPAHACYVAELLESEEVIFPPLASVLSAFGTLVTPPRLDLVRGSLGQIAALDWPEIDTLIREMVDESTAALVAAGCAGDRLEHRFAADLRYLGQQHEVTVALAQEVLERHDAEAMQDAFEASYEALYGMRLAGAPVEAVTWRVSALGALRAREAAQAPAAASGRAKATREILLESGRQSVPVYDRSALASGQAVAGPAIVEERETTIVLLPGWVAEVDGTGSILATRTAGRA